MRHSFKVEHPDSLLGVLRSTAELSSRQAKRLLDHKCVWVNEQLVWIGKHATSRGDQIVFFDDPIHAEARKPDILFEDEHLIVFNKRPYIAVTGSNALEDHLREFRKESNLRAVHRLDKETTGCLLFARTKTCRNQLSDMFRERRIEKEYEAVVHGKCSWGEKRFSKRLDGRDARTRCIRRAASRSRTLLQVFIETGRKHQVRRHLVDDGHPVVGDKVYGSLGPAAARHLLHARRLSFKHPVTGASVDCTAPRPADFEEALSAFPGLSGPTSRRG